MKTYGLSRRGQVPDIPGTKPKLCPKCPEGHDWFAAGYRERVCTSHRRPAEQAKRATLSEYVSVPKLSKRKASGQVAGRELCMELAREAAERIDYPKGAPQPMNRATKRRYTARNVALGLQDPRDLARYAA